MELKKKEKIMIKITPNVLHIPPYISTSWKEVSSLSYDTQNSLLIIILKNKNKIEIPYLSSHDLEQIFEAHASFLEKETKEQPPIQPVQPFSNPLGSGLGFSFPMNLGDMKELGNLSSAMQHDLNHKNDPDLPKELLDKFSKISEALGLNLQENAPEAEPHCNCYHCQIARALSGSKKNTEQASMEEPVSDEDLKFRTWDIVQKGEKLYEVTNPLDPKETYQVFLGDPIGCTCGHNDCEHIQAVLHS
jgi:hypothetical protein